MIWLPPILFADVGLSELVTTTTVCNFSAYWRFNSAFISTGFTVPFVPIYDLNEPWRNTPPSSLLLYSIVVTSAADVIIDYSSALTMLSRSPTSSAILKARHSNEGQLLRYFMEFFIRFFSKVSLGESLSNLLRGKLKNWCLNSFSGRSSLIFSTLLKYRRGTGGNLDY